MIGDGVPCLLAFDGGAKEGYATLYDNGQGITPEEVEGIYPGYKLVWVNTTEDWDYRDPLAYYRWAAKYEWKGTDAVRSAD